MDDQWPFTDDFVAADDWFLSDQPFWAPAMPKQVISPNLGVPATAFPGFGTLQPDSPASAPVEYAACRALSPSQVHHAVAYNFEARTTSATNPKRKTTYLRSTCATCDAPLDTRELVLHLENPQLSCNRSQALDHLPLFCLHPGCGLKFKDLDALRQHSKLSNHVSVHCGMPGCIASLCEINVHGHYSYYHGRRRYHCAECNEAFSDERALSSHGTDEIHKAFICDYPACDSTAATIWEVRRHELKHRKNSQEYPCPRCIRYRGNNSFKRKDHLRQHMRNFHLVTDTSPGRRGIFGCKHNDCYKINHPRNLTELATHMLEVHHSMPYVCNETDCVRTGMSGFENQKLLILHSKNDHVSTYQCKHLGCDRVGNNGWKRKSDAIKHMKKHHGIVEPYPGEPRFAPGRC